MANVLRAGQVSVLSPTMLELFGSDADPMETVDARGRRLFPAAPPILWECDAHFNFYFVNAAAEALLGHPPLRWLEPMFWANCVVHADDREDAIAYCTLASGKKRDHMFEYRARAADGRLVWLRDFVKVINEPGGTVIKLRGAMFDVTADKSAEAHPKGRRVPALEDLLA